MSPVACCVVNCYNNKRNNSDCKFYSFPKIWYKSDQKEKWINAVRRVNGDGSRWEPQPWDKICSAHFVGNKKSEEMLSPSYVPTVFPSVYKKKVTATGSIERHARFKTRNISKKQVAISIGHCNDVDNSQRNLSCINNLEIECDLSFDSEVQPTKYDKACQAEIFVDVSESSQTFICNRYIYNEKSTSEAEVQTEIFIPGVVKIKSQKKYKSVSCGPETIFLDKCVGPDQKQTDDDRKKGFDGMDSIGNNEQHLIDVAGVSFESYEFLLERVQSPADHRKVSKKNRLLIFLMKMRLGITFSALGVIFSIHRTTVSSIFTTLVQQLSLATANLVFWPEKDVIQNTMPKCFHSHYRKTRVIIDCTELNIDVPARVDNRVWTYSHYKKGFTAKVLIGITPSGFISLVSKVAGGRKSDSQLTIESGLLDLLENDDVVLADKGFPEIKRIIDNSGKKVTLVMPPFLDKNSQFSKKETEETYNIARVRIHVERIIQRLKTYHILNKIPENLFVNIDCIMHMCCVLVNLQPPIICEK